MLNIKPILKLLKANYISLRSYFISGVKAGLHKKKCSPGTSVVSPGRSVSANTQLRQALRPKLPREHRLSVIWPSACPENTSVSVMEREVKTEHPWTQPHKVLPTDASWPLENPFIVLGQLLLCSVLSHLHGHIFHT